MIKQTRCVHFNAKTLIPVIQEAIKNKCAIFLVKDHGLYMMSEHGTQDPETGKILTLSYADGFNPDLAGDEWYDKLRQICGGDDFCERLSPTDEVFQCILHQKTNLSITFTDTQLRLRAVKR